MKLYVRLEAPFEWVRTSAHKVEAFGEVASPSEYPLGDEDTLIGVVSGDWVTVHHVSLPAKSKRQFMTALPYALEDSVSEEIDDLHFSCEHWRAGEEVIVHVVSKDKMVYWQGLANDAKLPLDCLVPDYSLLPFHSAADSTLVMLGGSNHGDEIIARHKNGRGVRIDADFLDIWLADLPLNDTIAVTDKSLAEELIEQYPDRDFRLWEIGNKLAHWLEHPQEFNLDLFDDKYRPSVYSFSWRSYAIPAAALAAAVFVVFAFDTYRYFSLHAEIRNVLDQQDAILTEHFPEVQNVPYGKARVFMQRAIENSTGGTAPVTAVSMLASASQVLKRQGVSLSEISYRGDDLIITCLLNDLSQVDQITSNLNSTRELRARLESSENDDGQVFASYTLSPKA